MKILFIDHNDSFSNNIVSFFRAKKFCVDVLIYSDLSLLKKDFPIYKYNLVILSPGPGSPADYPETIEFYRNLPIIMLVLGICLGHQLMLYASGGQIQQICSAPIHGRQIYLNVQIVSLFLGKIRLSGTTVLYNSLGCFRNDPVFNTWHSHIVQNGICLMAEHSNKPHIGVQFHPESFASSVGSRFFNKFIRAARQPRGLGPSGKVTSGKVPRGLGPSGKVTSGEVTLMKKGFIVCFILFIVLSLFFQKKYLSNLKNQSKNVPFTGKVIIGQGSDFKTFFYNTDGSLKATLSGQKIVYYEDASFLAEGHLLYQSYNALSQPTAIIQTESGNGEFEVSQDKNVALFSGNKQLKWLILPQNVSFNFNGNQGTTKNVFIDALKRTISSSEHISSKGPSGSISANGFFYDVDKKKFKFNSKVNGTYKPSQNPPK